MYNVLLFVFIKIRGNKYKNK